MATAPARPSAAAAPPARPLAQARRIGKQLLSFPVFKPFWLALGGLAYLAMRLLEPWRRIEIDMLEFERIGHLVCNTEQYLRELALDPDRSRRLPLLVSGPPINRQALDMIRRKVRVIESAPARLFYMLGLRPYIDGTRFDARLTQRFSDPRPVYFREFSAAPAQLSFLPGEQERGRRLLRELGIPDGGSYHCFHSRDSAYLAKAHSYNSKEQWAYHDFRNCDIANYLPAAERLARLGLAGIRMGSVVEKPLASTNPLIIDYANKERSDFGDIFLIAHAKFYVGNTAGLTAVAYSFDVPVAQANLVPIGWPPLRPTDVFIPKKYWDIGKKRLLTFREIIALGGDYWNESQDYEKAGVRVIENSAEEITELVLELNSRLDGTWQERPGDEKLQARYRALFPKDRILTGYPSRMGADFIRRNQYLLE